MKILSATVTEIVDNIDNDKHPAGKIFDLAAGIAFDGVAGKAAGKTASKIAGKRKFIDFNFATKSVKSKNKGGILKKSAINTLESIENNPNLTSGQLVEQSNAAMAQYQLGEQLQGSFNIY